MPINISKSSSTPLYEQLLNEIRRCILAGEWAPGILVTSELTLQRELHISRSTIRQAFTAARNEGLIETVPGKGTYVSLNPAHHSSTRLVGFISPNMRSSFDVMLFRGAENFLRSADYRIIFSISDASLDEENRLLRLLQREHVAGVILWPVMGDDPQRAAVEMVRQHAHLVLLDRALPHVEADLVTSDNFNGGYIATQHLISLGHRKIGFLSRRYIHLLPIAERLRGYYQAMQDAALEPLELVLLNSTQELNTEYALRSYTSSSGEDIYQLCQYLASPDHATALFASNDLIATQVLRPAEMNNVRVPQDISLVGFDDLDFCSHLAVPLTTVAQDPYTMGFEAARQLLKRIEGDNSPPRKIVLPVKLVIRASTTTVGG